ncbi:MAG: HAMP domain-containing protein [Phyllobacteriaceae bacterium]|nr:HAMP domain-containing protein [Phyllobacteriaceae bacterium]
MSRVLAGLAFSSLARRILVLNLAALVVLLTGILYMNQFREGLIDARVESLMTQGEIIAGAMSSSASVDTDALRIDPDELLSLQAGQSITPTIDPLEQTDFLINPERVAPLLQRLISPTRTRARVYDRDGALLLDTRALYSGGQVLRYELEPLDGDQPGTLMTVWNRLVGLLYSNDMTVHREKPGETGADYTEVRSALEGQPATIVRMSGDNEIIVSVAVPVQRFRAVLGVLQLSTQGGDIDKIIRAERWAVIRVFAVAALVTALLSLLLASTIATPLKKLSAAAVRVGRGVSDRQEIPDFSARRDEVGDLSVALRDMTGSLYQRIDAIERFAADVAHELKNPLTSLRSAVETLPLVKSDDARTRLLAVIQHDVRRLDRLISDISDASRLDAELGRDAARPLDLVALLSQHVAAEQASPRKGRVLRLTFVNEGFAAAGRSTPSAAVNGHDLRLGQVVHNLIDNARSFVPADGGDIRVILLRDGDMAEIRVEDNGPGIRPDALERVFERFYTDRPDGESFGQNSGLGLSISRQIIEAHGGTMTAENIGEPDRPTGARFRIRLPLMMQGQGRVGRGVRNLS